MTSGTTPAHTTPAHTTAAHTTLPITGRRPVAPVPRAAWPAWWRLGLLWGTGGLTGSLLWAAVRPARPVGGAYRLAAGGALSSPSSLAGRRWPAGRAAWTRIAVIAALAAVFQGCYFTAVSLTSVSLATLVTIGSAPVLVLAAERVRGAGKPAPQAAPPGWRSPASASPACRPAASPRPRFRPAQAWRFSQPPGSPRSR